MSAYLAADVTAASAATGLNGWTGALAEADGVVAVELMTRPDGSSTKSPGPGHLCTHEVEVYIGAVAKKNRVVSGLSQHGGVLHVYFRPAGARIAAETPRVFREAVARFLDAAAA